MLHNMNQVLNPDQLFNDEARDGDLETPIDRFHDLILAVFRSKVSEACRLHAEYPNREPDTGLVQDAAAWVQELRMPDVSQQDIAHGITRWIISQAENQPSSKNANERAEQKRNRHFLAFL